MIHTFILLIVFFISSCAADFRNGKAISQKQFSIPNHIQIITPADSNLLSLEQESQIKSIESPLQFQLLSLLIKVDILNDNFALARSQALEESIYTSLKLINVEYFSQYTEKSDVKVGTRYRSLRQRSLTELMQLVVVREQNCFPIRASKGEQLECEISLSVPIINMN